MSKGMNYKRTLRTRAERTYREAQHRNAIEAFRLAVSLGESKLVSFLANILPADEVAIVIEEHNRKLARKAEVMAEGASQ